MTRAIAGGGRPFRRSSYIRRSVGLTRCRLVNHRGWYGDYLVVCNKRFCFFSSLLPTLHSVGLVCRTGSNKYAPRALQRSGIPLPPAGLVTASDVSHGKPHPAPYLAGAQKCNVDPTKCLIVEDAISGLKSGRAAGARTLAVCTSTPRQVILSSDADPDYIVNDLTKVSARWINGKIEVKIDVSVDES